MSKKPIYEELEKQIREFEKAESDHKQVAEALQEKQKRLVEAQSLTHTGNWEWDLQKQKLTWSDEIYRIFGVNPDEFQPSAEAFEKAIHPDDREEFLRLRGEMLEQKQIAIIDHRIIRPNNEILHVQERAQVIMDDSGEVCRVIGSIQEINERKRVDEELKESEAYLKQAQAIAQLGHWRLIPETGEVSGSDELYKIFGLNHDQTSFDAFVETVHPEDKEMDLYHIRQGIKYGTPWDIEHRLLLADGTEKIVHAKGEAITKTNGKVVGLLGTFQDISERKLAEQKQEEIQERLSIALQGSNSGIWDWDLKTNEVFFGENYFRMAGYEPDEFPHSYKSWKKRVHPEDLGKTEKKIKSYIKGEIKGYKAEFRFMTKSNGWMWILSQGRFFKYDRDGKPIRFTGTHYDITNRKLAELALENSHEILEEKVIERTTELEQLNKYLVSMEEKLRGSLADDLHDAVAQNLALSVSKIKTLKEKDAAFNAEPLSEIQGYVEQSLDEIRQLINQLCPQVLKDFDIATAIDFLIEKTNKKFDADIIFINKTSEPLDVDESIKVTLYRAVNEVLLNVLKHSGVKKAKVELKKNNDNIILSIEDSGIGFDPAAVKTTQFYGFGLFSSSRRIINMGGDLKIESTPGKGTDIIIKVPI